MGGIIIGVVASVAKGKESDKISLSQLKMHNTKDSLWVKIGSKVYDLTKFQHQHPGGVGTLVVVAGQDATQVFKQAGHSQAAVSLAQKYCIGEFMEAKTEEEKMLMKLLTEKEKEIEKLKSKLEAGSGSTDDKTVYELLGGQAAIDAFIPIFYKYNLSDDRIKHFFAKTDMPKLMKRQNAYLSHIFGGPNPYFGKDMTTAHLGMNLSEQDFNAVVDNAAKTLTDLGVSKEIIGKCAAILHKDKEACLHK